MRQQPRAIALVATLLWSGIACATYSAETHWNQKQFIITFWSPPPATDAALARVAAEGFNLTWVPPEGLDIAQRHHLRAILMSDLLRPETLSDDTKRKHLDALIEKVKDHPALEAYFLTDEPGAGAFPDLGKLVAHLRERDPTHLAYINLYPTYANEQQLGVSSLAAERARVGYPQDYAGVTTDDQTVLRYREHLKKFLEIVKPDLISYDHYHFLKEGPNEVPTDGKQYFLNLALIRLASLESGKPFLNTIQADTIEKSWRLPNAAETRWLVFTTLAYGGRGISYFTYWGPPEYNGLYVNGKPATRLTDVTQLNTELTNFGAALLNLNSVAVYHTAPLPYGTQRVPDSSPVRIASSGQFVLGLFGDTDQPSSAFLLVNRDYRKESEAVLRVTLKGSRIEELDRKNGKWSEAQKIVQGGEWKVKLQPGDGRLFRVR